MGLDDKSLADKIKQVVTKKKNADSIVYYAKVSCMQLHCNVTYKKKDKDSRYTTYEFFMVEKVTRKIMSYYKKLKIEFIFEENIKTTENES